MSTMTAQEVRRHLREADRCDRCSAQAFVHVELQDGMLLFCGHHYAMHQSKLEELALAIIDEREFINRHPSVSANAD